MNCTLYPTVTLVLLLLASAGNTLFAQQHPSREPLKVYLFIDPSMPNNAPGGMEVYDDVNNHTPLYRIGTTMWGYDVYESVNVAYAPPYSILYNWNGSGGWFASIYDDIYPLPPGVAGLNMFVSVPSRIYNFFYGVWYYTMIAPNSIMYEMSGATTVCGNHELRMSTGDNANIFADDYVQGSVEWEYNIKGSATWTTLTDVDDRTLFYRYTLLFKPNDLIPEVRTTKQEVRFRCRQKVVYTMGNTYYSPYSPASDYIEVLPAPPVIRSGAPRKTDACAGEQNGTVTVPASDISSAFSNMRWILRKGTVTAPCDPGLSGTTSNCGDQFEWSNGQVPVTDGIFIDNVPAGDYTLWIFNPGQESGNCMTPYLVKINSMDPLTIVENTSQHTNVSCYNGNNGALGVSAGGANANGTYHFKLYYNGNLQEEKDGPGPAASWSNLKAGTYKVEVKNNSCGAIAATSDIIISQPPLITGALMATSPVCADPGNGTITVTATPTGGTVGAYQFKLYRNNQQIDQSGAINTNTYTFSDLGGGTYTTEIINNDAPSCTSWTHDTTLSSLTSLDVRLLTQDSVTCNGGSDGILRLAGSGGTGLYEYTLSGTTNTTGIFTGLSAGTYSVTVKNQGTTCNDLVSKTFTVYQRTLLTVQLLPTPISCFGRTDAKLKAVVNGGSGSYSYTWQQWKNNAWTSDPFWFNTDTEIRNLEEGTYRLVITDKNAPACTATSDESIIAPVTAVEITGIRVHDAVCLADGAHIAMTGQGGTGPHTYLWSLDGGTTYHVFDSTTPLLTGGNYLLRLSDTKGCTVDAATSYQIVLPDAPLSFTALLSDYNGFNISCKDASDGSITVSATGGNKGAYSGYQYKLGTGNYQASPVFAGLSAGVYTVGVKDGRGCEVAQQITLIQPAIQIVAQKEDIKCYGTATGSITTNISGGVAPYVLQLNGQTVAANTTLSGLPQGTYNLHIRDANGCTKDSIIDIVHLYPELKIESATVNDIVCVGTTGNIAINVTGGDGVYNYTLSQDNWATTTPYINQSALPAGNYALRVADGQGCMLTYNGPLVITAPVAPVTFTALLSDYNGPNISCLGGNNGFAQLSASGGNGSGYSGYMYALDNGAYGTDALVKGINAGTHTLHVKDARGCIASNTYTFTEAGQAITVSIQNQQNVPCAISNDGSVTINGSGGTGILQYSIDNTRWHTASTFTGLTPGQYTVIVKDVNNCTNTIPVAITSADPAIILDKATVTDIVCYGQKGSIQVQAHGGSGTLTNEYAWNNGNYTTFNNTTPLDAGAYTLRIKDGAGCYSPVSAVLNITAPAAPLDATITPVDHNGVQISCYGLADGAFSITASGGNGALYNGYQYSVSNSPFTTTNNFGSLSAGQYNVRVQDGRGCTHTEQVSLQQPAAALTLSISDIQHLVCGADPTGQITLQATGGTLPYSYALDNGNWQNGAVFGNLTAKDYALQVRDVNGCIAQSAVTVTTVYSSIEATETIDPVKCFAGEDGAVRLDVTGGDGAYTYKWSRTDITGAAALNIPAGDYAVEITDGKGCKREYTYTVPQPDKLEMAVSAPAVCDGLLHGRIAADVTGGITPYQYSLDNGAWGMSPSFADLPAGTYHLAIRDGNDCPLAQDITIAKLNVKPEVNFLVASRKNALDTLVIKEISVPAPDNVSWTFHPAAMLLGSDNGAPLIRFTQAGTYWVDMTATFGSCTYTQRKELEISPYDPLAGPGYSMPVQVIDTVMLSPNPNSGFFNFKVKLNRKQQVIAYVYDMNGNVAATKRYAPALQFDDNFTIAGSASGVFILRIIAESESKDVRFIISR